jgi:hypothetical protein
VLGTIEHRVDPVIGHNETKSHPFWRRISSRPVLMGPDGIRELFPALKLTPPDRLLPVIGIELDKPG